VDIKENEIYAISPELLHLLLKDHTQSTADKQVNIFWATDNYASLGQGFRYDDPIRCEAITGVNGEVIMPRARKCREQQQQRSREMAEVFTPSWICNKQNNLIDQAWFGRENAFNTETDSPDGTHSWIANTDKISFPEGKTWMDYVKEIRMEITCGEAPYLVSRYDTVTGLPIDIERRIGLLDRKLRVVGENTESSKDWLNAAKVAYQSIYGYEWQGDNLVLAREALLYTFIDYYEAKFGKKPLLKSLMSIAYIISWNIWQMDGLKGVIPGSCSMQPQEEKRDLQLSLFFDDMPEPKAGPTLFECPGCLNKDIKRHNGTYCIIRDWSVRKKPQGWTPSAASANHDRNPWQIIRFIDLIK
jgi:predicted RNA-binding Zn-ribbon protein involved in translation (DUF1610 family)